MKFVKEPLFSLAQEWNWFAHFSGTVTACVLLSPVVILVLGGTSILSLGLTCGLAMLGGIVLEILQGTVIKGVGGKVIGASMKDVLANLSGCLVWMWFSWYSYNQVLHDIVADWYMLVMFLAVVGFLVYGTYIAYFGNVVYKQVTYMRAGLAKELNKALKSKEATK
jgi:hypothetical protein